MANVLLEEVAISVMNLAYFTKQVGEWIFCFGLPSDWEDKDPLYPVKLKK